MNHIAPAHTHCCTRTCKAKAVIRKRPKKWLYCMLAHDDVPVEQGGYTLQATGWLRRWSKDEWLEHEEIRKHNYLNRVRSPKPLLVLAMEVLENTARGYAEFTSIPDPLHTQLLHTFIEQRHHWFKSGNCWACEAIPARKGHHTHTCMLLGSLPHSIVPIKPVSKEQSLEEIDIIN